MRGAWRTNRLLLLCFAIPLTSCSAGPEIPSNAAGWFVDAALDEDSAQVGSRTCDAVTSGSEVDLDSLGTYGALGDLLEMLVSDPDGMVGWRGTDHQYTAGEELNLEVDEAWTEMELVSEGSIRVWRLHMVREDGRWKACDAELRK